MTKPHNEPMTYEHLVEECKRLRLRSEMAEAEFFAFLMVAERQHQSIWAEAGCTTFEQFLTSNHLCKPDRYRFFAIGVDRVGLDAALANGAYWTICAGRMPEPSKSDLQKFDDRAKAFVQLERTLPSEEAVRQWAAEIAGRETEPRKIVQVGELERLREENRILHAKLAAAEKRIAELEGRAPVAAVRRPRRRSDEASA